MLFSGLVNKLVRLLSIAGGFSNPADIERAKRRQMLRQAAQSEDAGNDAATAPPDPESVK